MKKHGLAGTNTYRIWQGMKTRCENPKAGFFHMYGGRGITVCDRWHKFEDFLADMGKCPKGWSIERIDVNGNYEPGNCKWIPRGDQNKNKRNSAWITARGETRLAHHWEKDAAVTRPAFMRRIRMGWTPERAMFTPADQWSGNKSTFPTEMRKKMIERKNQGAILSEISKEFGISISYASQLIRKESR